MPDVLVVSETLVNDIRSKYPDDIAIIAYYGSYAQGTAAKRSDLDFFFIPATSKGYNASIQFIVDDISLTFGQSVGNVRKEWPRSMSLRRRLLPIASCCIFAQTKILIGS